MKLAGAFSMEGRWSFVSGEQSIPAGGAGEHKKILLDRKDNDNERCLV